MTLFNWCNHKNNKICEVCGYIFCNTCGNQVENSPFGFLVHKQNSNEMQKGKCKHCDDNAKKEKFKLWYWHTNKFGLKNCKKIYGHFNFFDEWLNNKSL
jgi:hypothetical protein